MATIFAPETDSDHAVGQKRLRQRQFRDSRPATCTQRLAGRGERRDLRLTGGDVGKFASRVVAGQPFTTGPKLRAAVARASPLSRPPVQNGHPWSAPPSDGAAP